MIGRRRELHGSAENECFSAAMALAFQVVSDHLPDDQLTLVVDTSDRREDFMHRLVGWYKSVYDGRRADSRPLKVHGPSFRSLSRWSTLWIEDLLSPSEALADNVGVSIAISR